MDGQWEIQPAQPMVTKAALDDFKPGRGLPSCVLEARPLCEDFPQLLHQVILNGIKPPLHKVILSYMPSRMNRDYPSGATVRQQQSPLTVQAQVDVCSELLTFSKDMSNEQLALWLRNHPSLSGTNYEKDISKLRDARINGHVFLSLNKSRLEYFSVSVGFQFAIMNIIEDMLQKSSHQSPSSERLPLKQQSPRSSVATPRTTQHQLSSSTAGQQTKLEPVPHPQALSSGHPKLVVPPQALEFSKDMSYEQLAVWLTNHPQFVGEEYQQDISKLRDAKINGFVFLNLNESMLRLFGVSFGFQFMLINIIGHLNSQSTATCVDTTMIVQQPSPHATVQQKQTGVESDYLGPNDLRNVQRILWEARTHWYNLGLELDITPDSLDSIELANSGKPDRCFRAMLTKWLREHQRPTWSALAEAVRSPSVGLSHLAEEIQLQ